MTELAVGSSATAEAPAATAGEEHYALAAGVGLFTRGRNETVMISQRALWQLPTTSATLLLRLFGTPRSRAQALGLVPPADRGVIEQLVERAVADGFLTTGSEPDGALDGSRLLEPHDALFHRLTRTFIRGQPFGPMRDVVPPQERDAGAGAGEEIVLPQPDEQAVAQMSRASFHDVLEGRRTRYSTEPLPLPQLAAVLYWSARSTGTIPGAKWPGGHLRTYPSGGGIHSLDIHVVASDCPGLAPAFYRYDSDRHALRRVHDWCPELDQINAHARVATGGRCPRPAALLIAASDVGRVTAKYQAVAYSLVLKEVGAWQQTVYLVATALQCSPVALGFSDASLFARLLPAGDGHISVGEMIVTG